MRGIPFPSRYSPTTLMNVRRLPFPPYIAPGSGCDHPPRCPHLYPHPPTPVVSRNLACGS
eukprot:scaffold8363_cov91-Isochrysis_galbana.AAC.1